MEQYIAPFGRGERPAGCMGQVHGKRRAVRSMGRTQSDADSSSSSLCSVGAAIETTKLQNVRILLSKRDGSSQLITIAELTLRANPSVSEFRLALAQTCLSDPENDAFLQKWARILYCEESDIAFPERHLKLDNDSLLSKLVQTQARDASAVVFCVQQCRNPRFSNRRGRMRAKGSQSDNSRSTDSRFSDNSRVDTTETALLGEGAGMSCPVALPSLYTNPHHDFRVQGPSAWSAPVGHGTNLVIDLSPQYWTAPMWYGYWCPQYWGPFSS